jgi:hypothetical protein
MRRNFSYVFQSIGLHAQSYPILKIFRLFSIPNRLRLLKIFMCFSFLSFVPAFHFYSCTFPIHVFQTGSKALRVYDCNSHKFWRCHSFDHRASLEKKNPMNWNTPNCLFKSGNLNSPLIGSVRTLAGCTVRSVCFE